MHHLYDPFDFLQSPCPHWILLHPRFPTMGKAYARKSSQSWANWKNYAFANIACVSLLAFQAKAMVSSRLHIALCLKDNCVVEFVYCLCPVLDYCCCPGLLPLSTGLLPGLPLVHQCRLCSGQWQLPWVSAFALNKYWLCICKACSGLVLISVWAIAYSCLYIYSYGLCPGLLLGPWAIALAMGYYLCHLALLELLPSLSY